MKNLTTALVGTLAAGALAVSTASPALARDNGNGISTGEVIAGALIIGGIAAVAAAASKDDGDRYGYGRDYDRSGYRYGSAMDSRQAVSQCVRAAEAGASRYSYGRANVRDIRSVKNKRNGYDVKGRIAVNNRNGWNRNRSSDTGNFTCKVRYGRVTDLSYSGLRRVR